MGIPWEFRLSSGYDNLGPPWITWTTWFTLGPLTSVPSWTTPDPPTSVPPWTNQIIWTIQSLRLSMTLYGLPHLDSIISLSCHSLNLTCTRLPLEIQCLRHSDLRVLPPIHSSGSCTSPQLRLVLSPSTLLSVFRHCVCIVL